LINTNLKKNESIENKLEIETIFNYGILFSDNLLFKQRQNKRFKFIEEQFKNKINKILVWDVDDDLRKSMETIHQHTRGEIKDLHFSFKSHKIFSEFLYKKLFIKPELI